MRKRNSSCTKHYTKLDNFKSLRVLAPLIRSYRRCRWRRARGARKKFYALEYESTVIPVITVSRGVSVTDECELECNNN